MKERPILFSGAMVRAILDGRKTQTRRVVKMPRGIVSLYRPFPNEPENVQGVDKDGLIGWYASPTVCPYGAPGDRLWVRETFGIPDAPYERRDKALVIYRADQSDEMAALNRYFWRPSIHMPRWACRLVLEVTGVRVERLQDISSDDAIAEGIEPSDVGDAREEAAWNIAGYEELWDSLNAKRGLGWATNPWVWVVEFRRAA